MNIAYKINNVVITKDVINAINYGLYLMFSYKEPERICTS